MIEKYERMTVAELKQKAKEFGLKNISGMKKQELIELLAKIEEKVGKGKKEQNEEKKHSRLKQMLLKRIIPLMIQSNWTVERQKREFWKCWQMDMDLFVVIIFCQGKMMCMFHQHRFVVLT